MHTYGLGRLFLKVVEFLRMKGRRKTATRQILKLSRHAIAMKKKKGGRKKWDLISKSLSYFSRRHDGQSLAVLAFFSIPYCISKSG